MKILVIKRTKEQDWMNGQIVCEESKNIQEYWKEYQKENQVPFELDFHFVRGNHLCSTGGWTNQWGYYYDKETLMKGIKEEIEEGSIDGILIDPILTEEEQMDYKSCNVVRCDTAEEIYATFAGQIPIAISVPMECSPLFEQTNFYQVVSGSAVLNHRAITPIFHLPKFSMFYTPMFRYFVEEELEKKRQQEGKQKKIEKN